MYTIDLIDDAIDRKVKIEFQYYEFTPEKNKVLKHNGYKYHFSPYTLFWNRDYYYSVVYSDKHSQIVKSRVNRIAKPTILYEKLLNLSKISILLHIQKMYFPCMATL